MKSTTAKPRGGMSANPFAGRTRLDRLDLMQFRQACDPPEKVIYLETIADAVHNYLFFGLGRNGTTAEEFGYACLYLFYMRAEDPMSWQNPALSAEEGRNTCFDTHYEFSGMAMFIAIDRFLGWLQEERREILEDNIEQVSQYVSGLRRKDAQEAIPLAQQVPLCLSDDVLMDILTRPSDLSQVANLVYYPRPSLVSPN